MKKIDWLGKRFGVLTVIGYDNTHTTPNGRKYKKVKCLCDVCGDVHVKLANSLHNKCTCPKEAKRKTHGKTHTPLYNVWFNISYKTCMTRYYRGHSIEECLNLVPLKDKRRKTAHNAILYEYEGNVYSIGQLVTKLNMSRSKLYSDLKKGVLPKGVTKYNGR